MLRPRLVDDDAVVGRAVPGRTGLGLVATDTGRGLNDDLVRLLADVPPLLVRVLRTLAAFGALAVPLEVVQSRTVGPTLGADSIRKSLEAGIVGLAIVALFMILYYRLPGGSYCGDCVLRAPTS